MLSGLRTLMAGSLACTVRGMISHQPSLDFLLETIVVLSITAGASAFLVLVWRLCGMVQQFVAASLQRVRTEQRVFEMLGEYMERQRLTKDQLWSASCALSSC